MFTESVKSFQVPATPLLPLVLRVFLQYLLHAQHVLLRMRRSSIVPPRVDGIFQIENFSLHVNATVFDKSPLANCFCYLRDVSHCAVRLPSFEFTESGQSLPCSLQRPARMLVRRAFHQFQLRAQHVLLLMRMRATDPPSC
jgi:hypothetical protein